MRYVCPLRRGSILCKTYGRSDTKVVTLHSCSFLHSAPLFQNQSVSYIPRPLQEDGFAKLADALTGKKLLRDNIEQDTYLFVLSFFRMVAKCNISFLAATSTPFKQFLSYFAQLCNPTITDSSSLLLSKLHLKTLAHMVLLINREQKKTLLNQVKNKSASLMMDAADIGGKSVVVVTLLPHCVQSKPQFFKLVVGCSGASAYQTLAKHLIDELAQNRTRILVFCTDGLPAQVTGIQTCIPNQVGTVQFFPYHIWCCNHLTNLVIHDSIEASELLSLLKSRLLLFATDARKRQNRNELRAQCPAFVETRWYVLDDIVSFALNKFDKCLNLLLLQDTEKLDLYSFKILLYPLIHLHLVFESDDCRLRHVFPAVVYAINLYLAMALKHIFTGPWLAALSTITDCLYNRFLTGSIAEVIAAAYSLTPEGTIGRKTETFTRPQSFPLSDPSDYHGTTREKSTSVTPSEFYAPPLSTLYVDNAIQHVFVNHFPNQTEQRSIPVHQAQLDKDSYLEGLIERNIQLSNLITALHQLQMEGTSSEADNNDDSTDDRISSTDINWMEVLSEQLIAEDEEESNSDEDYVEPPAHRTTTSTSSSSSSSSSSSLSKNSAAAQASPAVDSHISRSLLRNELVYDVSTNSIVSQRTLLKRHQASSSSSSSQSSSTTSDSSLILWDAEGTPEVLELEPHPTPQRILVKPIPSESVIMNRMSFLYSVIHTQWYSRIIKGFQDYVRTVLRNAPKEFLSSIYSSFAAYLDSASDIQTENLDTLFFNRSADTIYTAIYCYLAHGLVSASCSEASCERCFSILRWIVGSRRYSLSLNSLACLLSLCAST